MSEPATSTATLSKPPKRLSLAAQKKIAAREAEEKLVEYLTLGRDAGCSAQQMELLCKGGIILQPKQLEFAAASRLCDFEDGPIAIGFGGARGGGKTHCVLSVAGVIDCQRYPGLKVLFLRKVGKSNKEQFEDFRKRIFALLPHDYREQKGTLTFHNGSTMIIGHFKDEKDIDNYLGLEYDVIVVEEATTLTHSKWQNILTCLRSSKPGWRPRAYLSTNPGNVGHQWFKQVFIVPFMQRAQGKTRFIPATVRDNKFVNKEYVTEVLENLTGWQREAWLNGNWDVQAGQFFTTFREDTHVLKEWDERQAVRWYAALDYGWNHYTVFHLAAEDRAGNLVFVETHRGRKENVAFHAESILYMLSKRNMRPADLQYIVAGKDCFNKHPDGTTISDQYGQYGLYLELAAIDRVNGWSTMLRRLGDPEKGITPTLFVHQRCRHLIEQIPVAQHDPLKPEDVLKMNCSEDGEGGDDDLECCFVAGTKVETIDGPKNIEDIKVGDLVLTRIGYLPVEVSQKTNDAAKIYELTLDNGTILRGTGNHPVWVEGEGWRRLDSLRMLDNILECSTNNSLSSNSEDSPTGVIQNQNTPICGTTFGAHAPIASSEMDRYTLQFTSLTMDLSPKDIMSIIRTEISSITHPKTLKCSRLKSIVTSILSSVRKNVSNIWRRFEGLLPKHTELQKCESGQEGISRRVLESILSTKSTSVSSAEKHTQFSLPTTVQSSVEQSAKDNICETREGIEKTGPVSSAVLCSQCSNTPKPKLVPRSVLFVDALDTPSPVYNLQVAQMPEFFANGILVHNCRFLVCSNPSSAIQFAKPLYVGRPFNKVRALGM